MKHNWEKRADRQTEGKIVRLKGREKQWKTLLREIESKQQKERQFHYQRQEARTERDAMKRKEMNTFGGLEREKSKLSTTTKQ